MLTFIPLIIILFGILFVRSGYECITIGENLWSRSGTPKKNPLLGLFLIFGGILTVIVGLSLLFEK